jgi:hypothetical protein
VLVFFFLLEMIRFINRSEKKKGRKKKKCELNALNFVCFFFLRAMIMSIVLVSNKSVSLSGRRHRLLFCAWLDLSLTRAFLFAICRQELSVDNATIFSNDDSFTCEKKQVFFSVLYKKTTKLFCFCLFSSQMKKKNVVYFYVRVFFRLITNWFKTTINKMKFYPTSAFSIEEQNMIIFVLYSSDSNVPGFASSSCKMGHTVSSF